MNERKGSYAIEFAMLFPIVVMSLFIAVEFSNYIWVRSISTNAVIETCGENFMEDIGNNLDCHLCYGAAVLEGDYWTCTFEDNIESFTGVVPDAMRPINLRIETISKDLKDIQEMLDELEERLGETGD